MTVLAKRGIRSGKSDAFAPAVAGGDEPPHDSEMERRVTVLETEMKSMSTNIADIKTDLRDLRRDAKEDFRILFGVIVFVALGLAGIMAKGFGWL